MGVSNFLGSVLSQQKFEATDGPELQPLDAPVLQLCVTAQFYLKCKGRYILEAEEMPTQKMRREKRPLLPRGLPYVKRASQGCCLFSLRSSLQSSDFYFHGFPSLCFSHWHFGFLFPILTTEQNPHHHMNKQDRFKDVIQIYSSCKGGSTEDEEKLS